MRWACARSKASINDCMGGTDIICRLHHLVNENYQQESGCHSSGWWRNRKWKDCRSCCTFLDLCSMSESAVRDCCLERGWHPETEAIVLEHQMALRQLLLRFWVTDHGDCHFREESLEKVTVVTSKRRQELSKSSNTRFTEFSELVGRRASRGIPERFSRWDWERF